MKLEELTHRQPTIVPVLAADSIGPPLIATAATAPTEIPTTSIPPTTVASSRPRRPAPHQDVLILQRSEEGEEEEEEADMDTDPPTTSRPAELEVPYLPEPSSAPIPSDSSSLAHRIDDELGGG